MYKVPFHEESPRFTLVKSSGGRGNSDVPTLDCSMNTALIQFRLILYRRNRISYLIRNVLDVRISSGIREVKY